MGFRLWMLLCLPVALLAYADYDLDGVEDRLDRCPDTPLTDLVDAQGCTVASTNDKAYFDIVTGLGYSSGSRGTAAGEGASTASFSFQADYYRGPLTLQLSTSFYDSDNSSGTDDTLIAVYYLLKPTDALSVGLGAGAVLPTYDSDWDNEATDYRGMLNLSYIPLERVTLFGGFSYTLVNDDDVYNIPLVGNVRYQNTRELVLGGGYNVTPKLYTSLSLYRGESIYHGMERIESVSLYGFYSLNDSQFLTLSYSAGLSNSASDNAVALRWGVSF